jgi:cell division transport system permease protein
MAKKTKNNTLDRLKTMSKNSRGNLMRNNLRILKYGVIGYGRNIWLSITSTFVMTLTLILLFVTIIASIILSSTADRMRDKIDITIFFRPGTEISTLQEMTDIIKKDSNVKSAEYSTSEQEYEKFVEETKKTVLVGR